MIKNYIWDFDGMLFDTYHHTTAAFCETYRRMGTELDKNEVFSNLKISLLHAYRVYETDEKTIEAFFEIENDLTFEPVAFAYEKIPEALKLIWENGGKNFLYTHRDKVAVEYLEKHSLSQYFEGFITRENNFPLKPAPDAIEYICAEYALKKDETMMLGDRLIDIGSGKNAGVHTCLFDEFNSFSENEAEWYFNTTADIYGRIREEIKKQ